ncbi:MAG: sigmaY antisigma factor component [Bacillota bacterium]|nr:sigmaY antisigma factor component [Bacillota bacterium]
MKTKTLIIVILIVAPLLIIQALWIFRDARKRGEKGYILWGLFGLINVPESLLVYLIVTRLIIDKYLKRSEKNESDK